MSEGNIEQVKGGVLFRSCEIEPILRENGEKEDRRYRGTLTSETPVERWFGYEVLSHERSAVDLSRMKSGAPVLLHHDSQNPDNHVGIVEAARLRDGVLETDIRIASDGVTEQADKTVRKIDDGILTKASAGYIPLKIEETKRKIKGIPVYLVTRWMPIEHSLVPIPADNTVGLFRSTETDQFNIEIKRLEMPDKVEVTQTTETAPSVNTGATQDLPDQVYQPVHRDATTGTEVSFAEKSKEELDALKRDWQMSERKRLREIQEIRGRYHTNKPLKEACDIAIRDGHSLHDLHAEIIGKGLLDNAGIADLNGNPGVVDMEKRELEKYNINAAIAATDPTDQGTWADAPFEREVSDFIADQVGKPPRGFYVPIEKLTEVSERMQLERAKNMAVLGQMSYRAPPMSTTGEGSHLVGTQHLAERFIDALRPFTVIIPLGAQVITGLVQNVSIPKLTGSAPFEWLTEDQDATDVEATTGAVTMSPKTIATAIPYTRKLRQQSLPSIDNILMNDVIRGAGIGIDYGSINGTGASGEMTGILNQAGVGTVSIGTPGSAPTEGQPTWANILEFEEQVSLANADGFAMAYLMAVRVRTHSKGTLKSTGVSGYLWDMNNVNGYPAVASNQMPTYGTLYGDYNQTLIGFWGTLDILMDWATKAKSGGMVLRCFQDADTAVRHGVAFSKSVLATP